MPASWKAQRRVTSPRKTRVAIVFGGRSTEHAISCVSAGAILGALDPGQYEVVPVGITREGRWVLASGDASQLSISDHELTPPRVPGTRGPGTRANASRQVSPVAIVNFPGVT